MGITRHRFGLMFNVEPPPELRDLTMAKFGLDEKAIERAQRRAANKTAKWFRTRVLRELGPAIGIPQKIIRDRFRVSPAKGGRTQARGPNRTKSAFLWFGTNHVDAMQLPRRGRSRGKGYAIGHHYFEGGFRAFHKADYGVEGIFARKDERRLPIIRQGVPIHEAAEESLRRLMMRGEKELLKRLRQELDYEMHKKLGNV